VKKRLHLVENDVCESMHILIIDQFLQQNASRAVEQARVFTQLSIHPNLTSTQTHAAINRHRFLQKKCGEPNSWGSRISKWGDEEPSAAVRIFEILNLIE